MALETRLIIKGVDETGAAIASVEAKLRDLSRNVASATAGGDAGPGPRRAPPALDRSGRGD